MVEAKLNNKLNYVLGLLCVVLDMICELILIMSVYGV